MRSTTYIAVFEPSPTGGFSVYFPDVPGCTTVGGTFREAMSHAADALGLHLYGMEADGETIPVPSDIPAIDPETEPGYILSPVTVFQDIVRAEMDNRAVRTNTTLPAWLKAAAEAQGINFSRVLQASLMEILKHPHPHV